MSRCVVDTNVPVVANGRSHQRGNQPSIDCRIAAVRFLQELLKSGKVLVDMAGKIQAEYRTYLVVREEHRSDGDRLIL